MTWKEAEKVSVPVCPKMHQLDLWKYQLTMALVTALGDTDRNKWMKWLARSWSTNPELDVLNKVKKEYRAIDVKLCLALMSMLKTSGDPARIVRIEVEKLQRRRAKRDKILSGREVIAIVFESFRSSDNADVMCMIDNLIHMKYPGDSKIYDFYTQWHTLLEGVRVEDIPPTRALRDILYKKIRDSTVVRFDLSLYDQFADSDPGKTYDLLMSFIVKRIKLDREKKNQQEKRKLGARLQTPSPVRLPLRRRKRRPRKKRRNKTRKRKKRRKRRRKRRRKKRRRKKRKRKREKKRRRKRRRKATSPTSLDCPLYLTLRRSCVLIPAKEKEREIDRTPPQEGISVRATSTWSRETVRMGRIVRLRVNVKLREQAEKNGPPRSRSASPKGRDDKACRDFQKGNCSRGDKCPYSHKADKPAAPAIKIAVSSTALP